jgi:hypothetical protein
MNSKEFKKELKNIMPGYKWTIHRPGPYLKGFGSEYIGATGIQTAGYNRMSTLQVIKYKTDGGLKYEVKSSGFGKNDPWLSENTDTTLARALRGLQDHYERTASNYRYHALAIENGRKKKD